MTTEPTNYINRIKKLNNTELIELLNNANYELLAKCVLESKIDGTSLLNLTELDTILWKLRKNDRIFIWQCILKIKQNPDEIFETHQPEKSDESSTGYINILKPPLTNNKYKKKIRQEITKANKFATFPLKNHKVVEQNISTNIDDYVPMTKVQVKPVELLYDENGYLKAKLQETDQELDHYELEPPNKLTINDCPPIENRPPQTLPRQKSASFGSDNIVNQATQNTSLTRNFTDIFKKRFSISRRTLPHSLSQLNNTSDTQKLVTTNDYISIYDGQETFCKTIQNNSVENLASIKNRPLPNLPKDIYDNLIVESYKNDVTTESFSDTEKFYYENREEIKNTTSIQHLLKANTLDMQLNPLSKFSSQETLNKLLGPLSKFGDSSREMKRTQIMSTPRIPPTSNEHMIEDSSYGVVIINLHDEPYYRNTDRKGAILLLQDLADGAFLFRPSKHYYLTLSMKHQSNFFNLGIQLINNKIRLETDGNIMTPEFTSLKDFVEYFTKNPIVFRHKNQVFKVFLNTCLPTDRF